MTKFHLIFKGGIFIGKRKDNFRNYLEVEKYLYRISREIEAGKISAAEGKLLPNCAVLAEKSQAKTLCLFEWKIRYLEEAAKINELKRSK